jgi:hypothetical protein
MLSLLAKLFHEHVELDGVVAPGVKEGQIRVKGGIFNGVRAERSGMMYDRMRWHARKYENPSIRIIVETGSSTILSNAWLLPTENGNVGVLNEPRLKAFTHPTPSITRVLFGKTLCIVCGTRKQM